MAVQPFAQPLIGLGCFQFWKILKKVAVNIHGDAFVWAYAFISHRKIPNNGTAEVYGKYYI